MSTEDKIKVVMVEDRPIKLEKGKGYVELEMYHYSGSMAFSFWNHSNKKEKQKHLKSMRTLQRILEDYIDEVEDMEERKDG